MHSFVTPSAPQIPISPDVLIVTPQTSIGIEEVRNIQSFLSNKPFQSQHNTVIILEAHLLTIPAQNAFLKTLEEPPGNSQIYLVTSQPDLLLPTVLSRCEIISSTKTNSEIDTSQIKNFLNKKTIGERLIFLEELNLTRIKLEEFLTQFEHYLHQNITDDCLDINSIYKKITKLKKYLKSNCNLKLIITQFSWV